MAGGGAGAGVGAGEGEGEGEGVGVGFGEGAGDGLGAGGLGCVGRTSVAVASAPAPPPQAASNEPLLNESSAARTSRRRVWSTDNLHLSSTPERRGCTKQGVSSDIVGCFQLRGAGPESQNDEAMPLTMKIQREPAAVTCRRSLGPQRQVIADSMQTIIGCGPRIKRTPRYQGEKSGVTTDRTTGRELRTSAHTCSIARVVQPLRSTKLSSFTQRMPPEGRTGSVPH